MRLEDRFEAVNRYRKKMFQKVKAAVKKKTQKKKTKQALFQYDPWSYALNFDDGGENLQRFSGEREAKQSFREKYIEEECEMMSRQRSNFVG